MSRTITVELTDEEVEWMTLNWVPQRQDLPIFSARAKIFDALVSQAEPKPIYKVTNFTCDLESVKVTLTGPLGDKVERTWNKVGAKWGWRNSSSGYIVVNEEPYIEDAVANHDFLSTWFLKDNASYYGRSE